MNYPVEKWLSGDISSGLTVGIVNLPQGTSRHISIGTFAVVSIMTGDVLTKNVPDNFCELKNTTCDIDIEREKYAVAISLVMSIQFFIMYLLNLGFVSVYLSSHMISGFTCGAAFHVMMSQIPKLVNIKIDRQIGYSTFVKTTIKIFQQITEINWYTTAISIASIIFLVIGKEINFRYKAKLPFPLPWELVIVIVTTIASYVGKFSEVYDVSVVGSIPTGLRTTMPEADLLVKVIVDTIPIGIVAYAISISLSRMFAVKHAYEIDSNQELFAFSLLNGVGSFFGCFPSSSSLSRSVIQDDAGGNTQVAGIISSLFVLIVLLAIGPLFEQLPKAALAAIIVVNLKRLLKQFNQLPGFWKISKIDTFIWIITWCGVFFLSVDMGLIVGIAVSIVSVTIRTQMVQGRALVPLSNHTLYRDDKHFSDLVEDNEDKEKVAKKQVVVFSYPSPIYFANTDIFKSSLSKLIGFDPSKEGYSPKTSKKSKNR